jgi:two-component system KDP operon response regulator KdpE
MKLMIVDDHVGVRRKIRELLARPDVEAREYATAEEAISAADIFRPDWIIIDLHLPGLSGFEAIEIIRPKVPQVRIIVISADDKGYLREAARAVGAERFLSKHDLADVIQILSEGSSSSHAA